MTVTVPKKQSNSTAKRAQAPAALQHDLKGTEEELSGGWGTYCPFTRLANLLDSVMAMIHMDSTVDEMDFPLNMITDISSMPPSWECSHIHIGNRMTKLYDYIVEKYKPIAHN